MKKIIILTIVSALLLQSCKKADNLTPVGSFSVDSVHVFVPEENKTYSFTSFPSNIPVNSNVTVKIRAKAESGFEQIDYKFFGDQTVWSGSRPGDLVNGAGSPLSLQNVPFDWVGLNTIKGNFDSDKETIIKFTLPNVKQVTKGSFIIIDKKLTRSVFEFILTPVNFAVSSQNQQLVTQNAVIDELDGDINNKKMFFSLVQALSINVSEATIKGNLIDFVFANDSLDKPKLFSAELVKNNLDTLTNIGLKLTDKAFYNGLSSVAGEVKFLETNQDFSKLTVMNLLEASLTGSVSHVVVESGKNYWFESSRGIKGLLRVESVENGTSGTLNTRITFSYKSILLRQ
ncbi:MAG: hypothetical protein SNJ77_05575 [Cytophagales bacterium]